MQLNQSFTRKWYEEHHSVDYEDYVSRTIRKKSSIIRYYTGIKINDSVNKHGEAASHLFCVMFLINAELIYSLMRESQRTSIKSFMLYTYQPELLMSSIREMENMQYKNAFDAYFGIGIREKLISEKDKIKIPNEIIQFLEKGYIDIKDYRESVKDLLRKISMAVSRAKGAEFA